MVAHIMHRGWRADRMVRSETRNSSVGLVQGCICGHSREFGRIDNRVSVMKGLDEPSQEPGFFSVDNGETTGRLLAPDRMWSSVAYRMVPRATGRMRAGPEDESRHSLEAHRPSQRGRQPERVQRWEEGRLEISSRHNRTC